MIVQSMLKRPLPGFELFLYFEILVNETKTSSFSFLFYLLIKERKTLDLLSLNVWVVERQFFLNQL